jgi:hypothetical protein
MNDGTVHWLLNWYLPSCDQYLIYAYKEGARWVGENGWTLLVVSNILTFLKVMALKTKNVVDDKIVSLLIYFFSFKWVKAMMSPVGTKEKPYPLDTVATEEEVKQEALKKEQREWMDLRLKEIEKLAEAK